MDNSKAHSLSSCFKVLLTLQSSMAVEQCRLACGGHGFLNASNLPIIYKDLVATITAEGEVTVLLLQAARYLLKSFATSISGQPLASGGFCGYLWSRGGGKQVVVVDELHSLVLALQYRARGLLERCYRRFELAVQSSDTATAWNTCSVQLCHAATAHIESVVATVFVQEVEKHKPSSSSKTPASTYTILKHVCNLHLVHTVLKASGDLLQLDYIVASTVDHLQLHLEHLYHTIRPDVVSLVDAFDYHDRQLNSALGCYDGNVYERLFEWAQGSVLNETQVHPAITKYLKPMREKFFSKL